MAKGFIQTIELGRKEGTFSGTIVQGDGDPLGTFTDIVINTGAGTPIKSAAECGPASFVQFFYEGGVEGNPVTKINRLACVTTEPAAINPEDLQPLRNAARAVEKGDGPMIGKVVIVKG